MIRVNAVVTKSLKKNTTISFLYLFSLLVAGCCLSDSNSKLETGKDEKLLTKEKKIEKKIKIETPDKKFIYGTNELYRTKA